MPFLRNAWYAAGWDEALGSAPLALKVLGEPVVIYRDSSGAPTALADTCPHRFAPLSLGRVDGDTIRCPYHGLEYDKTGACIRNPHGAGAITSALKVRRYPTVVQDGLIWIWMGEEGLATAVRPPKYDFLTGPGVKVIRGYLSVSANYQLVMDNLLDLSHAEFLHPFIAPPGTASSIKYRSAEEGERVSAFHSMPGQSNTPLFRLVLPEVDQINGRAHMHWEAPANMYLDTGVIPLDGGPEDGAAMPQVHLLTPETETSTHYFWAVSRDRAIDDLQLDEMLRAGISNAFENEDEPMIRAVQERMQGRALLDMNPALLPMDAAAIRARRILEKKIASEG